MDATIRDIGAVWWPNVIPNSSGCKPSQMFKEELCILVIWIPNSYACCQQHRLSEHGLVRCCARG